MILDKLLQFDPAATAITVTAASTNTIDALAFRDFGVDASPGANPMICVTIGSAFTAAGAATLQVQVQASVDNATWTVESQTDAIPKANLTAGQVIRMPMPIQQPQSAGIPRYYRLNYVVATGPMTAGTVEADLVYVAPQLVPLGANGYLSGYPAGVAVAN